MSLFQAVCKDDLIQWDPYNQEDICCRFPAEEWQQIAGDIFTEEEWKQFLNRYNDLVECYILRELHCHEAIGFVYLYKESFVEKIVSIHGGGWDKSMRLSLLYYRGLMVMIDHLQTQGYKVRTSCMIGNERAFRFLRSVGFVKYHTSATKHHMWINEKRLKNSPIYKRLKSAK